MAAPSYVYDLLYSEATTRWNGDKPLGSAVTITFSFSPTQSSLTSFPGYVPMTAVEMAATRKALTYISSLTKIAFVETAGASGELVFGKADLTSINAGGVAHQSLDQGGTSKASVLVNTKDEVAKSKYQPGSITLDDVGGFGWQMLLHEIGHALGLKHPHDMNNAQDPNSLLPKAVDNHAYTLMSYVLASHAAVGVIDPVKNMAFGNTLKPSTYGLYDIAALQYLYGAPLAAENKAHVFSPGKPVMETIYDKGLKSTVDLSAFKAGVTVDMRPGAVNNLPIKQGLPTWAVPADTAYNGTAALAFAFGSAVARAIGGAGGDRITGNSAQNTIDGGMGNDVLNGLEGSDTLIGGVGKDTFVFSSTLGAKNVDTITKFSHKDDTIWLDDDVFGKAGLVPASDKDGKMGLSPTAFWASVDGKAHEKDDRIIYNKIDGHLVYDANGSDKGKAVTFAKLDPHLALDASDFILVV